ncbi:MAG: hypothetical protein ABEJ06_01295 [Haloarculaceae archaeon]
MASFVGIVLAGTVVLFALLYVVGGSAVGGVVGVYVATTLEV